jgi:hypothetical protein
MNFSQPAPTELNRRSEIHDKRRSPRQATAEIVILVHNRTPLTSSLTCRALPPDEPATRTKGGRTIGIEAAQIQSLWIFRNQSHKRIAFGYISSGSTTINHGCANSQPKRSSEDLDLLDPG